MLRHMMNTVQKLVYTQGTEDILIRFDDPDAALFAKKMLERRPDVKDIIIVTDVR